MTRVYVPAVRPLLWLKHRLVGHPPRKVHCVMEYCFCSSCGAVWERPWTRSGIV